MTEQELIDSMVSLTVDARAVLQAIQTYGTQNQDVVIALHGGTSVTVPSIQKQNAAFAAQFAADHLAFTQDFGGQVAAQTVTRDSAGLITGATTTLSSGWQIVQTYTRSGTLNRITGVTTTIKDALGATQAGPTTRTLSYDGNGRYSGMN